MVSPAPTMYFVASGMLRALIRTDGVRDVIPGDIGGGEFFGELAAIDSQPRSASVVALTGATLRACRRCCSARWCRSMSMSAASCWRCWRRACWALDKRVSELATLDVRHRLFAELLRISRPDGVAPGRALVSPPPYHAEIAARISARREAVTRELRALESAGLVEQRARRAGADGHPGLVALFQDPRRAPV